MPKRPGATQLTVMPCGPTSPASVFSQPVTRRTDRVRERDVRDGLLHRDRRDREDASCRCSRLRCGRQRWTSRTSGCSRSATASSSASGVTSSALPGGGPPEFQTRMSRPPNAASVCLDGALEIARHGHVAAHGERADAFRLALERVAAPAEDSHVRALAGERLGACEPEAGRRAHDERRASGQA